MNKDTHATAKVRMIVLRARNMVDVSKPNTIQTTIKSRCVNATVKMLKRMQPIADESTHPSVVRGLMLIANSTLMTYICVGTSPYENQILPEFATALAYDLRLCCGFTPSIQVMSQLMSMCGVGIKDRYANKNLYMANNGYMNRSDDTAGSR
jgi:hypothetical protein